MRVPGPGDNVPPCRSVLLGGVCAPVCLDVCGHVRDECGVQLCICGRVPCVTRARAVCTNVCAPCKYVCVRLCTRMWMSRVPRSEGPSRGASASPPDPHTHRELPGSKARPGCPPDPSPPPLPATPIGAPESCASKGGSVPRGCRDLNHVSLQNSKHLAKDK